MDLKKWYKRIRSIITFNPKELLFTFLEHIVSSFSPKTVDPKTIQIEVGIRKNNNYQETNEPKELRQELTNLTVGQSNHYPAISWLLNPLGPRGTGRTRLMALAFIEHSLNHSIWISIYDHTPNNSIDLLQQIKIIINNCPSLELKIKGKFTKEILVSKKISEPFIGYTDLKKI